VKVIYEILAEMNVLPPYLEGEMDDASRTPSLLYKDKTSSRLVMQAKLPWSEISDVKGSMWEGMHIQPNPKINVARFEGS
jgi:hypothetical protein